MTSFLFLHSLVTELIMRVEYNLRQYAELGLRLWGMQVEIVRSKKMRCVKLNQASNVLSPTLCRKTAVRWRFELSGRNLNTWISSSLISSCE